MEYIVATNEWYVKPTADRGRAEGWMCLASDPPARPELSKGTCEVWDGDRWTIQTTVTVSTAASGFESMLDVQIFCSKQTRDLQERLNNSLKKAIRGLMPGIPADRADEGSKQLDQILADLDAKLKKFQMIKEKDKEKLELQEIDSTPKSNEIKDVSAPEKSSTSNTSTTNKAERKI